MRLLLIQLFGFLLLVPSLAFAKSLTTDFTCDSTPIPDRTLSYCFADAAHKGTSAERNVDVI